MRSRTDSWARRLVVAPLPGTFRADNPEPEEELKDLEHLPCKDSVTSSNPQGPTYTLRILADQLSVVPGTTSVAQPHIEHTAHIGAPQEGVWKLESVQRLRHLPCVQISPRRVVFNPCYHK